MNIKETTGLSQCMSCDYTSYAYAEINNDCVCPSCKSTDYYILEENGNEK